MSFAGLEPATGSGAGHQGNPTGPAGDVPVKLDFIAGVVTVPRQSEFQELLDSAHGWVDMSWKKLPQNIIIFAPADVHALELACVMDTFHEANAQAGQPLYSLCFVAERRDVIRCASGLKVVPDACIEDPLAEADTLIATGSYGMPTRPSQPVVEWIRQKARHARRYGSVCTGTFIIGAAGLIDHRDVTTHWQFAEELKSRFPAARVDPDRIFIRDGPLFTSAGVSASIDLTLALIEEDHGRELALAVARHMVIYLKRSGGQSQYSAPLAAQASATSPVARVQSWVLEHPELDLTLSALASQAAMSPRNFSRVFLSATGMTPSAYVEQVRVDKARFLLEDTSLSLDQVARQSGLGTASSARRTFLRRLGITMRDYRGRFTSATNDSGDV